MSFGSVSQWAQNFNDGKSWISTFRKVPPSTATITGQWFDYSMASGVPVPNYYASSPLVAATLDSDEGIYIPTVGADSSQFLKRTIVMSAAATVTGTTNQNQPLQLLDYLLYYPFVDLDAAGDVQTMDNTVTLPRYTDGVGVQMMIVAQAPTAGSGQLTVTYIDADDVERTTGTIFCAAAQPMGALVTAVSAAAGVQPFLPLNANVRGVKSVVSVTMSVANGGLGALVLVKPLQATYCREECRRPTASPTESFGDAAEREYIRQLPGTPQLHDGAFLGFIGCGTAGSLESAPLVGVIETVWT